MLPIQEPPELDNRAKPGPVLGSQGVARQPWPKSGQPSVGRACGFPSFAQLRLADHWPCLQFPSLGPRQASLSSAIKCYSRLGQVRPAEHWLCLWFPSLGPKQASLSSAIQWVLKSGPRQAGRALAMPVVSQLWSKIGEPKFGHSMALLVCSSYFAITIQY